ncbi:MAG: hypothetical protein Q8R47_03425 [Nanoarchaeota archaeon]|nr:hypothetical protein [Nanoarchaeota archaeon]
MEKIYFAYYPNEEQLVRYEVLMPNYVKYNPIEARTVKTTLEDLSSTLGLKLEDCHKIRRDEMGAEKAIREDVDNAGPYFYLSGITQKEEFERAFNTKLNSIQKEKQYWQGDEFGASPTNYWMKVQEWEAAKPLKIPASLELKIKGININKHFELLCKNESRLSLMEKLLKQYDKKGKQMITPSL